HLNAGACATVTGTVSPPQGTYYVGAIADRFGNVGELIEDNNATAGNQVAVGNGPDFIVSSVSTAPAALPGAAVAISATVCNQGTQGAGAPLVEVFFST